MKPMSSDLRLIIWIITGIASLVFAILLSRLQNNLAYLIPGFKPKGRSPSKKPLMIWVVFWLSVLIMIVGSAIASSAPDQQPILKDISTVESTSSEQSSGFVQVSNHMLTYIEIEAQKFSIWGVLSDGSRRVSLTKDYASISGFDWSPDGNSILFSADDSIWELDVTRKIETKVVDQGYSPVYIPGSSKIAFVNNEGLWLYDRSSDERVLIDQNVPLKSAIDVTARTIFSPEVSLDGNFIGYLVDVHRAIGFIVKRISDGTNMVEIGNAYGDPGQFEWANSGQRVAIQTTNGVYIGDISTGGVTKVALPPNLDTSWGPSPAWTSDDSQLFFSAAAGDRGYIYAYNFKDSSLLTLREQITGHLVRNIVISPDGKFIAFADGTLSELGITNWLLNTLDTSSIWVITHEGKEQTPIPCNGQLCFSPAWQP